MPLFQTRLTPVPVVCNKLIVGFEKSLGSGDPQDGERKGEHKGKSITPRSDTKQ